MGRPYTLGVWTVTAGREDEFVELWQEFAQWGAQEFPGAGRPTLLRDLDQPNRFVTFGPFRDLDQVAAFRSHPGFRARVGRMRELLDDFVPSSLEAIVEP